MSFVGARSHGQFLVMLTAAAVLAASFTPSQEPVPSFALWTDTAELLDIHEARCHSDTTCTAPPKAGGTGGAYLMQSMRLTSRQPFTESETASREVNVAAAAADVVVPVVPQDKTTFKEQDGTVGRSVFNVGAEEKATALQQTLKLEGPPEHVLRREVERQQNEQAEMPQHDEPSSLLTFLHALLNKNDRGVRSVGASFSGLQAVAVSSLGGMRDYSIGAYISLAVIGSVALATIVLATFGEHQEESPQQRKRNGLATPSPSLPSSLPLSMHTVPPTTSAQLPDQIPSEYFCPELVVPQTCECVLVIPVRSLSVGAFDVTDVNGGVLLRVAADGVVSGSPNMHGATPVGRFTLTTGDGDLLAQGCNANLAEKPSSQLIGSGAFQLLRASGDFVASLARIDANRYVLNPIAGLSRLHFWGSFREHAVNITDEDGKLLATAEPCTADFDVVGEYYRLRVAPLMDVGLVLCSLLCIDHLSA